MYEHRSEFPNRRNMYTAKTVSTSAAAIAAAREEETIEWGTIDPTPQRTTAPAPDRSHWVDYGIAFALLGVIGGMTGIAGTTMLAAGAVVAIKANPEIASASLAGLRGADTHQVAPLPVEPTPTVAYADEAPAPVAKKAAKKASKPKPRKRSRARKARPAPVPTPAPTAAPTVPRSDESAMSLSQLKSYLTNEPAPAPAAAPARPAPAPAAPPPSVDDELAALIAEPVPQAAPARPAPQARPTPRAQGTARPAPAAPSGIKQLSTRLAKMPNGVLILDEPFDPVAVAIQTDTGAAVYVDGELLGGAPIAVVVDRGSHEVTIQAEKGTAAFDLDASEGTKWCFSTKRDPKLGNCR